MRIRKYTKIALALALVLACLCGCGGEKPERQFRVVLTETEHVLCEERVKTVSSGGDAVFSLTFDRGYGLGSVDGRDCRTVETERGVDLIVENVRYSRTIEVEARELPASFEVALTGDFDERLFCAEGENAVFALETGTGRLAEVGYAGGFEIREEGGTSYLTLKKVDSDLSVKVERGSGALKNLFPGQRAVRYELNGGTLREGGEALTVVTLRDQPRVNTLRGTNYAEREGYTLVGWNSKEDGSGEHIGLGSRVFAPSAVTLYAEWAAWSPESSFIYAEINASRVGALYAEEDKRTLDELIAEPAEGERAAVITGCTCEDEEIVLPETLGGLPVLGIAANAITYRHSLKKIVFPVGLKYVASLAFGYDRALSEVVLFDDLEYFSPTAFGVEASPSKLHLNAVLPPVYGTIENGQVANKIELLLLSSEPKLVLFGGCGVWYGVNAAQLEAAYGGKYEVYNMGVIGGTCALYQIDLIRELLHAGDVFVHMPELASPYQLLAQTQFDSRVFLSLEADFDLLARLDLNSYTDVWSGFESYLSGKRVSMSADDYVEHTYEDSLGYMGKRGDLLLERPGHFENEGKPYTFFGAADFRGYRAIETMKTVYSGIAARGVKVGFGYAPINGDGLNRLDGAALTSLIEEGFASQEIPARIVMGLDDCILDKAAFYDTNYHLSTDGARYFTDQLFMYLQAAGI